MTTIKGAGTLEARRCSAHAGDFMPDTGSLFDDDFASPPPKKPRFHARTVSTVPAPILDAPVSDKPYEAPTFKPRAEVRDFSMEEAIRAVGPLLHPEERELHKDILDPMHDDDHLKLRVKEWRDRNGIS